MDSWFRNFSFFGPRLPPEMSDIPRMPDMPDMPERSREGEQAATSRHHMWWPFSHHFHHAPLSKDEMPEILPPGEDGILEKEDSGKNAPPKPLWVRVLGNDCESGAEGAGSQQVASVEHPAAAPAQNRSYFKSYSFSSTRGPDGSMQTRRIESDHLGNKTTVETVQRGDKSRTVTTTRRADGTEDVQESSNTAEDLDQLQITNLPNDDAVTIKGVHVPNIEIQPISIFEHPFFGGWRNRNVRYDNWMNMYIQNLFAQDTPQDQQEQRKRDFFRRKW